MEGLIKHECQKFVSSSRHRLRLKRVMLAIYKPPLSVNTLPSMFYKFYQTRKQTNKRSHLRCGISSQVFILEQVYCPWALRPILQSYCEKFLLTVMGGHSKTKTQGTCLPAVTIAAKCPQSQFESSFSLACALDIQTFRHTRVLFWLLSLDTIFSPDIKLRLKRMRLSILSFFFTSTSDTRTHLLHQIKINSTPWADVQNRLSVFKPTRVFLLHCIQERLRR